ncbi:MAG: DUF4382 domain-containing protein [Deltaproteobacteria bacterium]|nr:DUF4382 domain-containing protein [Deltaproteobacteria bacterium]
MRWASRWSALWPIILFAGCPENQLISPAQQSWQAEESLEEFGEELANELGVEPTAETTDTEQSGTGNGPGAGYGTSAAEMSEESPIELCDCSEQCPPVNCPCVTRAEVEVIAVYIKKFRPRGSDNEPGSPWVQLEIDPGVYDLMQLKDDLFAGVNARNIPPGHYSMIRLTLRGQEIEFCDDPTAYPFYVAQENKRRLEMKKGIKIFETFYICPGQHTRITLKFPEEGLLTWIKADTLVRLHPKIWVQAVEYLPQS